MDNAMDRHLDGDRICDLAEGTLDPALRAEAEAHVRGCADCRRELEAARGYLRE
jgi:anti-sigma factor ChrR (cupin superfamily)